MTIKKGFLMPHAPIFIGEIGRGEEKKVNDTLNSMKQISKEIKEEETETIVIITPHGNLFRDTITINNNEKLKGSFKDFGAGDVKLEFTNDLELVNEILTILKDKDINTYKFSEGENKYNLKNELDHGALVPLYFINKEYNDFKLVHINYALLDGKELYEFGKVIKEAFENSNRKGVIIASGDLSHKLIKDSPNGYAPEGKIFDEKILKFIKNKEFDKIKNFDKVLADKAGECGLRSIQTLIGAFDDCNVKTKIYSYEGPFGVGYGCAKIEIEEDNNEDDYIKLAKETIRKYVKNNEKMNARENIKNNDLLNKKAGVFVSLKKDGELRGCIGTIFPTKESIADEIIENAISAATRDPRFYPVEEKELDEINYSVDILEKPEEVNSFKELDPHKYGVIVKKGSRKAVLLPNLEGIDTVEEQMEVVLRKAGIRSEENYKIERFKVIRHKE